MITIEVDLYRKNGERNHFISIFKFFISSFFICGYGHVEMMSALANLHKSVMNGWPGWPALPASAASAGGSHRKSAV